MCTGTFNSWVIAERMRARIVGDSWVSPQVLPDRFTGNRYRDFHIQHLPNLLEDVPMADRAHLIGAKTHFSRAVRDVLNNTFHDRWICTAGPTAWCPHSPDLNPLDFYLWEHLTSLVHAAPVDTEETLHHRTVDACETSATAPASLNGCGGQWWDVSRCALNLMQGISSTCYKCTVSDIAYNLNISWNMLVWAVFLVFVCATGAQSLSASFRYTLYVRSVSAYALETE
jgi:hypothetical protein